MVERIRIISAKWGAWSLFFCAFTDASFLPLPVTTLFLILIISNPQKAALYTFLVITGTLAGSLAGYYFGHFAWFSESGELTRFAEYFSANIPGFTADYYIKINSLFNKWDIWVLSIAAATPIPYGFFSIASGIFSVNIYAFFIITLISQGTKFIFLALITSKFSSELNKLKLFFLSKRIKGKTI